LKRMVDHQLCVLHLVSSLKQGGAERQLATIVNHSRGILNYVCSLGEVSASYLNNQDTLYLIKSRGNVKRLFELRDQIRKINPDVIYAWGYMPYLIASMMALGKSPKIINGSIRHGVFKSSINGYLRMLCLHLAKNVVANSRAGLRANGLKRGFVLYNGIDPKFDKARWQNISSKEDTERSVKLISVANIVPYKDYFTTLKALKRLRKEGYQFSYRIIGDGPLRDDLIRDIEQKGLGEQVLVLGRVSDPESYLADSDIFIHSSKGEGCSNAILEAMYMALPIIASDTGGTSEIVGRNAILFAYQNDSELYQALKQVFESKSIRQKMAEESYLLASTRFTLERMLEDYREIIIQVAGARL